MEIHRNNSNFISLKDLEVYKLARQLSTEGWKIYSELSWQDRKIIGDQFIESLDSVGANIAEGYFRFHYLYDLRACHSELVEESRML